MYETAKLKGRIVEKFESQDGFAAAMGCSRSYLSQYLNGKVLLSQQTIDKWATALEIASNDISTYFLPKRS